MVNQKECSSFLNKCKQKKHFVLKQLQTAASKPFFQIIIIILFYKIILDKVHNLKP